jgi:hypothetical protein
VGESLDQQLTAVGFAGDVAGAITVDTAATACATGTVVAHFMSTDVTNTIDVYYTIPSPFVSPATLTRTKCINGTLSTSAAVATRLSAAPTMSCATSCSTSLTAVSLAVPESGGTFTLQGRRRL